MVDILRYQDSGRTWWSWDSIKGIANPMKNTLDIASMGIQQKETTSVHNRDVQSIHLRQILYQEALIGHSFRIAIPSLPISIIPLAIIQACCSRPCLWRFGFMIPSLSRCEKLYFKKFTQYTKTEPLKMGENNKLPLKSICSAGKLVPYLHHPLCLIRNPISEVEPPAVYSQWTHHKVAQSCLKRIFLGAPSDWN